MKITIWGDFACPFCYLGETQLLNIIRNSGFSDKVTIKFKAYELDPAAPDKPTQTMLQHFMSEHDNTQEEARHLMERITRMASRVGLDYKLATVQVCSTFDAHRLIAYAQERATQKTVLELNFKLFKANFIDNLRLSDRKILVEIAGECGLDKNSVEEMLNSDRYSGVVREDEKEINGRKDFDLVPYMVFNNDKVLQGVISPGAMKKELNM